MTLLHSIKNKNVIIQRFERCLFIISVILLSWFFPYELIMNNDYSKPLLVKTYLSDLADEKCGKNL